MMHPRLDDLLANVSGSRYALVIAGAKRARQINNYHHQLGEGTFDDFPPPLVESRSKNYLAMNVRMWEHPATQANAGLLRERGVELVGPEEGELAEGEHGPGRMSEPEAIFARCRALLDEGQSLSGKRVLVSAGGTREPLDTVRFVGNRSSGKMGVAVAREARRRGAEVTLVAANLAVPPPEGVDVVSAPTAADLAREVLARR